MFETLSKLAKILFISRDKVNLKSETCLKAAGVAGVKKTPQEFRKQAVFYTPGGFSTLLLLSNSS